MQSNNTNSRFNNYSESELHALLEEKRKEIKKLERKQDYRYKNNTAYHAAFSSNIGFERYDGTVNIRDYYEEEDFEIESKLQQLEKECSEISNALTQIHIRQIKEEELAKLQKEDAELDEELDMDDGYRPWHDDPNWHGGDPR